MRLPRSNLEKEISHIQIYGPVSILNSFNIKTRSRETMLYANILFMNPANHPRLISAAYNGSHAVQAVRPDRTPNHVRLCYRLMEILFQNKVTLLGRSYRDLLKNCAPTLWTVHFSRKKRLHILPVKHERKKEPTISKLVISIVHKYSGQ